MKFVSSIITGWVLGAAAVLLGACGNTDAADNTPFEPSRETRIKDLAAAACDRYEDCSGYGTGSGQTYASEAECQADFTNKAGALWPDDRCGSGRINNTRYDACVASAKDVACGGGIIDTIAALEDCNAGEVCSDPPQ